MLKTILPSLPRAAITLSGELVWDTVSPASALFLLPTNIHVARLRRWWLIGIRIESSYILEHLPTHQNKLAVDKVG